jgi:hypothetical protein
MFWWVLSAFLGSASTVFYRLAIREWKYGRSSFVVLGNWIGSLMAIGLLCWYAEGRGWFSHFTPLVGLVFLGLAVSIYHNGNRVMEINKTEKISTLQIFGNISTIITVIAGFLLYGKTSLITLGIVLLCWIILFASQFEGKTFHPPAEWKKIVMTYTVGAINSLLIVWLISQLGSTGFFIASSFSATFTALLMMTVKGTLSEIRSGTPRLYAYRTIDGVFFNCVRFIHFFLIGTLGPVVTTLLGMLGNIATLLSSQLFLGEKNSRKEWGVNLLLGVLVGVGFYFK